MNINFDPNSPVPAVSPAARAAAGPPAPPAHPNRVTTNPDGSREGNGFRVHWGAPWKTVTIQDLYEGVWTEFGTYNVRETDKRPGFTAVSGKRPAIAADPVIGHLVEVSLTRYGDKQAVPVDALIDAVLGGEEEHPPTAWLIPTVKGARERICPPYYHYNRLTASEIDFEAGKVLMATTVLALCGGQADEGHLVDQLALRGFGEADALEMLDLASRKGTVERTGARSAPSYRSRRLDHPPKPVPPPAPQVGRALPAPLPPLKKLSMEDLFGDDD